MTSLKKILLFIALFVALAVLAKSYDLASPQLQEWLRKKKLVPIEEPLTELYFNEVETLSQRMTLPFTFSFTIRNREGTDMVYPYNIWVTYGSEKRLLESGTTTIANGQFITISETLTRQSVQKRRAVVELPEQQQKIEFTILQ